MIVSGPPLASTCSFYWRIALGLWLAGAASLAACEHGFVASGWIEAFVLGGLSSLVAASVLFGILGIRAYRASLDGSRTRLQGFFENLGRS